MAGMDDEHSFRECEAYVSRHNIQQVLKEAIVNLCVNRPENPIAYLSDYFGKIERVSKLFQYWMLVLLSLFFSEYVKFFKSIL